MSRYRFPAYTTASTPRYVVVWDLQWQIIDSRRLERATDLRAAMTSALEELASDGWVPEANFEYGFVFIRRAAERRLLMLTPHDPDDASAQSFTPFR